MDRDAITTVDAGRRRDAASALKMDGVQEAKLKQQIIKATASYLLKRGDEQAALRSEVEIADAVHAHQGVLDLAINIAEASAQNLVNPVLRKPVAGAAAYLMLTATPPWPEQRVREKMALFQTGQSSAGESEPTFIAGQIIENPSRKLHWCSLRYRSRRVHHPRRERCTTPVAKGALYTTYPRSFQRRG